MLPVAWQPLTFRGVAAFSRAKLGRLLLVQFIVALLVAGAVAWFLSIHWFPTVRKAIRQLPETGVIQNGRLATPRTETAPLVENRYLAIAVDATGAGADSSIADLRIEFRQTNFAVCFFAGCVTRPYRGDATIPFNRQEAGAWWGAWQPMLFGFAVLGVVTGLFASWLALATLYFPAAWLIAYFKDRQLTALGAWKLAAAALLPAALLVASGLVLYGMGIVDLLRLLLLWLIHFPVGWLFLVCTTLRLPRALPKGAGNPFGTPRATAKNPFTGSDS